MNGASCRRNLVAFLALRSISYCVPASPNCKVWSAGPPSRSSSRTIAILVAIGTSHHRDGLLPYRSCSPTVAVTFAVAHAARRGLVDGNADDRLEERVVRQVRQGDRSPLELP